MADGGSDELADAIVAWGTTTAIRARVDAHYRAGADHVAIQPLARDARSQLRQLAALAPVMID